MSIAEQIGEAVDNYLEGDYEVRDGQVVPTVTDIQLGKHGVKLQATLFVVDFRRSSKIVDAVRRQTAAKMYKSYLTAIAKVVRAHDGHIRSFTGDGMLAVFIGGRQSNNAVKAAMQTKFALQEIVQPKLQHYFDNNQELAGVFRMDFGIGAAYGEILAVRVGIGGAENNSLIWVGNATNFAAKMADEAAQPFNIFVTKETYNRLWKDRKLDGKGKNMWTWHTMPFAGEEHKILKTSYRWKLA